MSCPCAFCHADVNVYDAVFLATMANDAQTFLICCNCYLHPPTGVRPLHHLTILASNSPTEDGSAIILPECA